MSNAKAAPKDGIYNSSGFAMAGVAPLFLAFVPVTSWLTQPGGLFESLLTKVLNTVTYAATAGSVSSLSASATIPALSAVYIAFTYAITGALSVAGVAAGSEKGRSNNYPRAAEANLRGLPLRLKSAHMNLMEMFPGFALTAALTAVYAPNDRHLLNLLGLHVLSKVLLYYPSYALNVGPTRSLAHLFATSAVINVPWKLALGA